jgi:23S rRNA (uracil1939-C5)-methyltransferase
MPARAVLDALAREHGLREIAVISGETSGFRSRARLAIRGRIGSPKLGLFELGTHRVVHIPHCIVQHPLINRVASVARRAIAETRVTSYSDGAKLGIARYLQVAVERSSQSAQVVLVGNCSSAEPLAACLDLIRERLGGELHSLWFNANSSDGNTILGPEFENRCGPLSMVERFGGAAVHYPPGAFGQSNLEIAQLMIEYIRGLIPQNARVTEFYAGVGAIGLSLLDLVTEIHLNEVGTHSLHGLHLGLAELDQSERRKVSVIPGAAGEARVAALDKEVVIADPPRKGLDSELSEYLSEHPPQRFIYVSCGLESFLADCVKLTSRSKLRLSSLAAFNLLPFTEHVETVACFERL